jgi:hypothetical protein
LVQTRLQLFKQKLARVKRQALKDLKESAKSGEVKKNPDASFMHGYLEMIFRNEFVGLDYIFFQNVFDKVMKQGKM